MYRPPKEEKFVIELGRNWAGSLKKDLEFLPCSVRIAKVKDASDTGAKHGLSHCREDLYNGTFACKKMGMLDMKMLG